MKNVLIVFFMLVYFVSLIISLLVPGFLQTEDDSATTTDTKSEILSYTKIFFYSPDKMGFWGFCLFRLPIYAGLLAAKFVKNSGPDDSATS
jgi:hypothetical protein